MDKITEYKEVRKPYPCNDGLDPQPGEIFIFLDNEVAQAVNFICPCGCGSQCYTPLVRPDRPRTEGNRPIWDFSRGPNGVTISPSIRYTGGCKAHFNITDGKVIIHGDSGK